MIPVPKPVRIVIPEFRVWIRTLGCLLADEDPCTCGPFIDVVSRKIVIEAAHVHGVGAGGSDPANLVNLCGGHHKGRGDSLHLVGKRTFEHQHREALAGRTLKQIARGLWRAWPDRTEWLAAHPEYAGG